MSVELSDALITLINALHKYGLLDLDEFKVRVISLDNTVFICGDFRLDYDAMERSLRDGPIMLECPRNRAYMAARYLSKRLGKEVKRWWVGRRRHSVYILYTEDQADKLAEILEKIGVYAPCREEERSKPCPSRRG